MTLTDKIEKKGDGSFLVTALNAPSSLDFGATCLNPSDPMEKRIYQKTFHNKPIFLSTDYDEAVKIHVEHPDKIVISMNGYSMISDEQCRRYGVEKGAYEEACKAILDETIHHLKDKFRGAELRLIHGATYMGIDGAIQDVAEKYNLVPLGFSCPRYMLYVDDDSVPVYVGTDEKEYADRYIQTLDLLICTGGREQALQHDVLAACVYNKRIHFIDVLNSLSKTGGVPATVTDENGITRVDNAAAAMGRNLSFFSYASVLLTRSSEGDIWDAIFSDVRSVATQVCRQKMSPKRKFR